MLHIGRIPSCKSIGLRQNDVMSRRSFRRGARLGSYTIERELGAGSAGTRYLARTPEGLPRTLELVSDPPVQLEYMRGRFETLARVRHPLFVRLFEWGEDIGRSYYVMEDTIGVGFTSFLSAASFMFPGVVYFFGQVLETVAYLHGKGIVIGGFEPEDIIVRKRSRVLITEPGLACRDPQPTDDVFALGGLLYPLITGIRPQSLTGKQPPPHPQELNPYAPRLLSQLAFEMIHPDPSVRPQTAIDAFLLFLEARDADRAQVHSVDSLLDSAEAFDTAEQLDLGSRGRTPTSSSRLGTKGKRLIAREG